jgi:hypothetical protein
MQALALKGAFERGLYRETAMPSGVMVMLISAVGRAFVMEENIGISADHDATRATIEALISAQEKRVENSEI